MTYPGQLFDFLLQIAKIQIEDVGFAAELQGVENILFGGFVAAGDDNVVYFEAQAGAVVVKFRAEVGEFAADEVGLNGNDDGRQHKITPSRNRFPANRNGHSRGREIREGIVTGAAGAIWGAFLSAIFISEFRDV